MGGARPQMAMPQMAMPMGQPPPGVPPPMYAEAKPALAPDAEAKKPKGYHG